MWPNATSNNQAEIEEEAQIAIFLHTVKKTSFLNNSEKREIARKSCKSSYNSSRIIESISHKVKVLVGEGVNLKGGYINLATGGMNWRNFSEIGGK